MTQAAGAGFALMLAIAAPAAARGLPDDLKPRTTGINASAIAAGNDSDRSGAGALDEGRALLMAGNPAQALSAFQLALAQAPQSVAALNGIAIAYDRLGRSDLARQYFEMALALEPDAADIAHNLGLALVRAGNDRAAIPHLQRAAAGTDPRIAAAARRSLTFISARLTVPAPETTALVAAGPRIDMASSGEAVLVLAPAAAGPLAAPVRMAAAPQPAPSPAAGMMAAGLADRLGDVAALTIPIHLPEPPPEAPAMNLAATIDDGPAPVARQVAAMAPASSPASLPAPAEPLVPTQQPASVPAMVPVLATAQRQPAAPLVLAMWRRAAPADVARQAAMHRPASPPLLPDDDRAAIKLAIARLESLIDLIEVQRG
jgi:hypothetical protein